MGTWSYPLFVSVYPGRPQDYRLALSDFPAENRTQWRNNGFLCKNKNTDTSTVTLDAFMDTGCDSHKLIDHMSSEKIALWLQLLAYLAQTYPDLDTVSFHFFCTDQQRPYYFVWSRKEDGQVPRVLRLRVGTSESAYYFNRIVDEEGECCLMFNEKAYRLNWEKVPHMEEQTLRTFLA